MKHNTQRGYTLLFAVLLSSLILAVGISILNISRKELILSSSGRESQYAIYAADSGAECALYFDEQGTNNFSTSSLPTLPNISCNGQQNVAANPPNGGNGTVVFTFHFNLGFGSTDLSLDKPCAYVTVTKQYVAQQLVTTIDSRGYNTCVLSNPRRTERGIHVAY